MNSTISTPRDTASIPVNNSNMLKRTAQSPLSKDEPSKKQKVDSEHGPTATTSPVIIVLSPTSPLSSVPETPEGAASPTKTAIPKKSTTPKKSTSKKDTPKKSTTGAAPVADVFEPWTPPQPEIPTPSPYWGIIPVMKRVNEDDENSPQVPDPLPHPDQPSARTSNAATNPAMWEDLGGRFQRGSRYVKYLSATAPDNAEDLPATIDQEEHLQIKLIDMRPKSSKDRTPRRTPIAYHYGDDEKDEHGNRGTIGRRPKNWDNKQAVKCLNDRRAQAISRITMDDGWTSQEREYLASLFEQFPNASIWELTARHNYRFIGEFMGATGGLDAYQSAGRTVESVRHQYLTHKPAYDGGAAPRGVRAIKNNSLASKETAKKWKVTGRKFGSPDKALDKAFDAREDARELLREEKECAEGDGQDGEGADDRFVRDSGDELLALAGHAEWFVSHQPTVHTPSQASTPPARDSPQRSADNEVALYETKVHSETRFLEETVAEDGTVEQVSAETGVETVTEAVGSLASAISAGPAEKKRNASEVYREKMMAVTEDYDDEEEEVL